MRKYACVRRHRQHHQPADRVRAGARRPGAGHRPGAVGGGGVRRRRDAGLRLVRRLPAADRGRHDQLRRRPHHLAVDRPTRSAPRASARPARSPRRRPWSTRSSTPSATSGSTTSGCPARPERVWKAINDARRRRDGRDRGRGRAALRRSDRHGGTATARRHGRSEASDPRPVRLPRADLGRGGARRARRARRRRQDHRRRAEPAAGAADAAQRARAASSTSAGSTRCAASATTATRSSSAR